MTSDERHEQILLYVAGQLDPVEEHDVRAYLAGRDVLASAALAEAEATIRELLLTVPAEKADPALRTQLMQRIRSSKTAAAMTDSAMPARTHMSMIWPAVSALAASAAIALGSLFFNERKARQQETALLEQRVGSLNEKINASSDETESLKLAMVQMQRSTEVLQAENLKLVSLGGTESSASGRIFWDRTHNRWTVSVFKLQPLSPDKVYELWYINKQQQPVAAGPLIVDQQGNGITNLSLPSNMEIAAAGITSELRTSSMTAPTLPIRLSGKVE